MKSVKTANIFMLIFIVYQVAASVAFVVVLNTFFADSGISTGTQILTSQFICMFLPVLCVAAYNIRRKTPFMFMNNPGLANSLMVVAMGIFIQPAAMVISAVSSLFFDDFVAQAVGDVALGAGFLPTVIIVALVPAICEELVFRGIFLFGYRKKRIIWAALINGLFFGIIHLNMAQFFYAFLLGCILACVTYYAKSVFAGMIMHFTINASQTALVFVSLPGADSADTPDLETIQSGEIMALLVFALISTLIFVCIFLRFVRKNRD